APCGPLDVRPWYKLNGLPWPAQTALITGASSGIGRAVAVALGRAGANVLVNDITDGLAAETVVEEIQGFGANALAYKADVSDEAQILRDAATGTPRVWDLDILVANAGVQEDAPVAGFAPRCVVRSRQDHLHELGASGDPLGRTRELCRIQRRYHDDDA